MQINRSQPNAIPLPQGTISQHATNKETTDSTRAYQSNTASISNSSKIMSVSSNEGLLELGRLALGNSTIDDWANKGITLSDESLIAAAKAVQDGFKSIVDQQGTNIAGSRVSINKHQIVINNESQVPDWFSKEYELALASVDDSVHRDAFKNEALFFAFLPPSTDQEISTYQAIAESR